jgi:PhnB protein
MPGVTPYLCANGAADAIEFYKRAFGATERYRLDDEAGRIGHAEIVVHGTVLYLSDEWQAMKVLSPNTLGGHSVSFVIDVDDVDAEFQRAVDAGATVERPITDAPYGRGGWLVDPFGHRWNIQQPNPNFKPEDMK